MDVPQANIYTFTEDDGSEVTFETIKEFMRERILEFQYLQDKGTKKIFLFVYVSGHGVCENGQQCFLLNKKEKACIPIEAKLRTIAKSSETNILAFYDCCRTNRAAIPGLASRGEETKEENDVFAKRYVYAHICTHPNSVVDGESPLAKLTIERLNSRRDNAMGLINIPRDLEDLSGSESIICGGNYHISW